MPTTSILRSSRTVHPTPIGSNPNCIDKNNNLNSMQHTLHHPPIHHPPQQPLQTTTFHNNDVLCGRGGTINAHPGNEQYRKFVERKKRVYLTARFKREKRLIAQSIVDEIRALDPPGRFLLKDARESIWRDVGDEKARDKTSQALRENAGIVRKEMEEEYQETRRQQVRDDAIAMGKCPEEAVKNMMSVAQNAAALAKHAEKSAKEKKQPAPIPIAKSSAVQQKPPPVTQQYTQQPPAPPPAPQQPQAQGWGYHHHHQPPSQVQQTQQIVHQHNADPNYPYFNPPTQYSHPSHQQQVVHPSSQMQQHLQAGMQQHQQQTYGAPTPQPPAPSPEKDSGLQQVPNEQYKLFLEWQRSSDNSRSSSRARRVVKPQHTISQPVMPPPPPSAWEPTPISEMVKNQSTLSPKTAATASQIIASTTSPPIAAIKTRNSSRDGSPGSDRHVQFQNDIPLMIDSKSGGGSSKIQPRVSMPQQQQHHQLGGSDSVYNDYIPDASMSQSGQSTSPRSHANMSQNMSQSGNTHATPLTFLSSDMSVKTSDTSLNYYLQGLEDEISGDVGQEVELVAHAPMLDEQQHHNNQGRHHHHHHGGIPSYHNRSTPPRYGGGRSHGGSSHKSGSGNSRRGRRRRTGNHIPSNSGKVQLDLSNLGGPSPSGAPTFVGAPPQASQQVHQQHETVPTKAAPMMMMAAAPSPTYASGGIPCGAACGDGGVILPTPLRNTQQPKHSPPSSAAMGPPAPLNSPGINNNNNNALAPLSPGSMVNSLDLDKMSLCGTENVSHAGGSIGGASLCNVFDDNDDSIIGSGNLMDMTMSLGSGGTNIGSQAGKSPSIQSLQLGLGENESLIDMSVGSGGSNSKMGTTVCDSQNSGSGGSSSRSRRSGSPASIDKADVDNANNKIAEVHQQFVNEAYQPPSGQQETPVPVYGQDFKFNWDGKRDE